MEARVWLFIFLYGACTIIGAMLSAFWARFAWQRCRVIEHPCLRDRAFVLASSIAAVAGGTTLMDGARTFGNLKYGLSSILRSEVAWIIGLGLVIVIVGLFKMVWLADLERHPPKWTWLRAMLGLTVLWGVVAALLTAGVPYHHV